MSDLKLVEETNNELTDLVKLEIDIERVNQATTEYNNFKKEIEEKRYIIKGGVKYFEKLRAWIINDAKWSYSEVLAITKLQDTLAKQVENNENDEVSLLAIEMRAFNHLFQKTEGKGYHSAFKFQELIMPIIEVLSNDVKEDDDKLSRLQFKMSALSEGIEPAEELMDGLKNNNENEA